jgi:hypothetical protein
MVSMFLKSITILVIDCIIIYCALLVNTFAEKFFPFFPFSILNLLSVKRCLAAGHRGGVEKFLILTLHKVQNQVFMLLASHIVQKFQYLFASTSLLRENSLLFRHHNSPPLPENAAVLNRSLRPFFPPIRLLNFFAESSSRRAAQRKQKHHKHAIERLIKKLPRGGALLEKALSPSHRGSP